MKGRELNLTNTSGTWGAGKGLSDNAPEGLLQRQKNWQVYQGCNVVGSLKRNALGGGLQ